MNTREQPCELTWRLCTFPDDFGLIFLAGSIFFGFAVNSFSAMEGLGVLLLAICPEAIYWTRDSNLIHCII